MLFDIEEVEIIWTYVRNCIIRSKCLLVDRDTFIC